jgi:hypothetical protein
MIAKGMPFYAVVREETATGYFEVLSCGMSQAFAEGKMDDYKATTSGKQRKVSLVKLVVESVVEEYVEVAVRE